MTENGGIFHFDSGTFCFPKTGLDPSEFPRRLCVVAPLDFGVHPSPKYVRQRHPNELT